jgi:DNA-binding SARP family transcriptional activator
MGQDRVEIRLFGPFRVRRADGTEVDTREWRTGKTADLLRLLAVCDGQAVAVDTILDALWPRVDREKGLASLRTAASQIRRVLRQNCIERRYDGLMLVSAWTDTVAFARLAADCRRHAGANRWTAVIAAAYEADSLYAGDLRPHDPSVAILDEYRVSLRELHLQVLLDGADAAVELHSYDDGIAFARKATELDPFSERAYRALMRSHAGAGETQRALAAFDRCRAVLSEELGVEPAPQTRALYERLRVAPVAAAARRPGGAAGAAGADARRRLALLELIVDVASEMGHQVEAEEAYQAAQAMARRHGIPVVERPSMHTFAAYRTDVRSVAPIRIGDLVRELNRDLRLAPQPADTRVSDTA